MFLTRGEMPLESVWREFFTAAAALEPRARPRSLRAALQHRAGAAAALPGGEDRSVFLWVHFAVNSVSSGATANMRNGLEPGRTVDVRGQPCQQIAFWVTSTCI